MAARAPVPQDLDLRALRRWPLPAIAEDADKEDRGRVLLVAGSREVPGAVQLAGLAALRAGAGKLAVATGESVAAGLASAMPEARVVGLPESTAGSFRPHGITLIEPLLRRAAVVLVGPGMMDEIGTIAFVSDLLALVKETPVVLDALAMNAIRDRRIEQPVLLTPHAGELAHLGAGDKASLLADPLAAAVQAARRWNVTLALKGGTTVIATPDGRAWRHCQGLPGLATSGSGDVLAGLVAGFAARGAPLEQACAWGVVMHARAGRELARREGPIGFLARDLAVQVPALVARASGVRLRRPPAET